MKIEEARTKIQELRQQCVDNPDFKEFLRRNPVAVLKAAGVPESEIVPGVFEVEAAGPTQPSQDDTLILCTAAFTTCCCIRTSCCVRYSAEEPAIECSDTCLVGTP